MPTFRRSPELAALLPAIETIIRDDAVDASVLVVDNDPDRSAAPIADAAGVGYAHVPTPGIAAARQAALEHCAEADLVVMIDDDVVPEKRWLRSLVETHEATAAAAVVGYVRYIWPADADPWIRAGGFMRRNHLETGVPLREFAMGNVLLDVAQVRRRGVRFDSGLGLSGGEDTAFSRSLVRAGARAVACAESIVVDHIPSSRTTRRFVRTRTISHGRTRSALAVTVARPWLRPGIRAAALTGGLLRAVGFSCVATAGATLGRRDLSARMTRRAWFGWGRAMGAVGGYGEEYGRATGGRS